MPGPNGMELFDKLRVEEPHLPIIFLTGHGDVSIAVEAMRRGAFDFLTKPVEKKRLLEVVSRALQHEGDTREANSERAELRKRFETLTATEKQVFQLVVKGLPNKAIASEIGNAERTVKLHRSNLSRKLGAQCVADLVRFYYEAGLE
jgi:FixJ family two-component response regulator